MKKPISLIIDDATPFIHVYHYHVASHKTQDGRPLLKTIPLSFLNRFCDVVEKYQIGGKFSIVPCPASQGNIIDGVNGYTKEETEEWLNIARKRLAPTFSFCPEMINHYMAVNLEDGSLMDLNEADWSQTQSAETLTAYISKALEVCRDANINCTGVTSPWNFGAKNQANYYEAVAKAMRAVNHRANSWCFCVSYKEHKNIHPWIAYQDQYSKMVHIPATVSDSFWQTIDCNRNDEEYVKQVADCYISENGKSGSIVTALENNCWPVLVTHWQAMFSNGLETGVNALELVAERLQRYYADQIEWVSFEELMNRTIDKKYTTYNQI